ncbi:hypothetical protein GCM10020219_004920 [Nonomuraea dietziae]
MVRSIWVEQRVEPDHLGGILHLRQHHAVEELARALDHLDHVAVGPLRGQVVDPDDAHLAAPVALAQGGDDVLARLLLGQRRDGVLEVEEDLVGGQRLGLLQEARVGSGDREARTA